MVYRVDRQLRGDVLLARGRDRAHRGRSIAHSPPRSRSRLTAILNRDRTNVSTDLMLRILASLGYRTKMTFTRIRPAA